MNFDTMLNEYLDGTLTEAGEQMLFNAIAMNDDFRRDFTDSLRVRAAVQQEAASIIVPDEVTVSLFTSLGYMTVAEITQVGSLLLASLWRSTLGGLHHLLPYTIASCIGAAAMWFFITTTQPTTVVQSVSSTAPEQSSAVPPSGPHFASESPLPSSPTPTPAPKKQVFVPTIERKTKEPMAPLSIPVIEEVNNDIIPASAETTIQPISTATFIPSSSNVFVSSTAAPTISPSAIRPLAVAELQESPATSSVAPVELSLRALHLRPQTSTTVASNDNIGINNIALGMYYRLSENWLAGFEAGRESFVQQYRRENATSIQTIQQYPALWWGGLGLRFEGHSLLGDVPVYPLAQGTAGFAESGLFARISTGIGWDVASSVSLTAGAEWAHLFYTASGASYTTNNLGWMYGVNIRF